MSESYKDLLRELGECVGVPTVIPSLEEWSKRVDQVPRLDGCGQCGAHVLIDTGTGKARCAGGCGWTGVVLRRLP